MIGEYTWLAVSATALIVIYFTRLVINRMLLFYRDPSHIIRVTVNQEDGSSIAIEFKGDISDVDLADEVIREIKKNVGQDVDFNIETIGEKNNE